MRKLAAFVAALTLLAPQVSAVALADDSANSVANDLDPAGDCYAGHLVRGNATAASNTSTTVARLNAIKCGGGTGGSGPSSSNPQTLESGTTAIGTQSVRNVGTSSTAPTKKYVPYNRLVTGPDGKPCATTGYVEEGATPPAERLLVDPNPRESNIPITGNDLAILQNYPPCPLQPTQPGQAAPVETPSMIAARYWEEVPLPEPAPMIAPGRAITGKPAYLETKGEISHTYGNSTILGPLQIFAQGTYSIDWGDGTSTGPFSFEGKPWPDGRITHQYIKVGTYNVVVTEKWTARWSLGGESGTLRTLETTGRIDNFPVEQIQAVIGR